MATQDQAPKPLTPAEIDQLRESSKEWMKHIGAKGGKVMTERKRESNKVNAKKPRTRKR